MGKIQQNKETNEVPNLNVNKRDRSLCSQFHPNFSPIPPRPTSIATTSLIAVDKQKVTFDLGIRGHRDVLTATRHVQQLKNAFVAVDDCFRNEHLVICSMACLHLFKKTGRHICMPCTDYYNNKLLR